MVHVRLAKDWTDSSGTEHSAGAMVEVDAATLAKLEAKGVVAESPPGSGEGGSTDGAWPAPTSGTDGAWPAPTSGTDGAWPAPTSSTD